VALDTRELVDELRWPAAFGRDGWVSRWMEKVEQVEGCLWVRVPEGESARPFWEHLRLFASLRGKTLRGLDLAAGLAGVEHGVALDEWSARGVLGGADWIAVLASDLDAWKKRALESLECAARIEREKRGGTGPWLFVVSDQHPTASAFETIDVPAVTEEAIARFLERPVDSPTSSTNGPVIASRGGTGLPSRTSL
jgi:hypothetical protein